MNMGENNNKKSDRVTDCSFSSDEEHELRRNHLLNQRTALSMTSNAARNSGSSSKPSTSGQMYRQNVRFNRMLSGISNEAINDNARTLTLSFRSRKEGESARLFDKLMMKNKTQECSRTSTLNRQSTSSTASPATNLQNISQDLKNMIVMRKVAHRNNIKLWTSILKNASKKNLQPSSPVNGARYKYRHPRINRSASARSDHLATRRASVLASSSISEPSTATAAPRDNINLPPATSSNITSTSHGLERVPADNEKDPIIRYVGPSTPHCDFLLSCPYRSPLLVLGSDEEPNTRPQDRNNQDDVDSSPMLSGNLSLEEEVIEVASDINETSNAPGENVVEIAPPQNVQQAAVNSITDMVELSEGGSKVKEINKSLLRLLECPVCLEYMEPPISQCRRGHLVCFKCRSRLSACPVCRTAFSSVRNRAMEGVSEIVRYPCRHGCGRETRLRKRPAHEANCVNRTYGCPVAGCSARARYAHADLLPHFQTKHMAFVRVGHKQIFSVTLNEEHHLQWLVQAYGELFNVGIEVNMHAWSLYMYVAYIGPKRKSGSYLYEVSVLGKYNDRKLVYSRATHSDLESNTFNVGRYDCFYISLDQAMNYIRFKNKYCDPNNELNINLALLANRTVDNSNNSSDF